MAADVTDEVAVRGLFDTIVDRFGRVDLLFDNAGTLTRLGRSTRLR